MGDYGYSYLPNITYVGSGQPLYLNLQGTENDVLFGNIRVLSEVVSSDGIAGLRLNGNSTIGTVLSQYETGSTIMTVSADNASASFRTETSQFENWLQVGGNVQSTSITAYLANKNSVALSMGPTSDQFALQNVFGTDGQGGDTDYSGKGVIAKYNNQVGTSNVNMSFDLSGNTSAVHGGLLKCPANNASTIVGAYPYVYPASAQPWNERCELSTLTVTGSNGEVVFGQQFSEAPQVLATSDDFGVKVTSVNISSFVWQVPNGATSLTYSATGH
jgi:hypothetical protein